MTVRVPWVKSDDPKDWPSWYQKASVANRRRADEAQARRKSDPTYAKRYQAAHYAARKASGRCVKCGDSWRVTGRLCCGRCLEIARADAKRRGAERRKGGACPGCGAVTTYHTYCERCYGRDRARFARRRTSGRCVKCGVRDPAPKRKLCALCLAGSAERRRTRIAARRVKARPRPELQARIERGECGICGEAPAAVGHVKCSLCLADGRRAAGESYRARKSSGCCVSCGATAAATGVHCARCRDRVRARLLRKLTAGNCSCGWPVVPGQKKCKACRDYQREYGRKRRAKAKPFIVNGERVV